MTARVDDGEGGSDQVEFQIEVIEVNTPPDLQAIGDQAVDEQTEFTIVAQATDSDAPANPLVFSLVGSPSGANIDPQSGRIRWTPGEADGPGEFDFTVRVSDSNGGIDDESFVLTVREVNLPPTLRPISDQSVMAGMQVQLTATADDPDLPANDLTFSLIDPPTGAAINSSTGEFTWSPTEQQLATPATITVQVSDNGTPALTDRTTFTVTNDGCPVGSDFSQWTVFESGGGGTSIGTVDTSGCQAIITEGNSFVVGLQASFVVPENPSTISFTYEDLNFDTTDPDFINDAFEVALVDRDGNSLVDTYRTDRDVFFNVTEGMEPALGSNSEVNTNQVSVDISGVTPGEVATLVLRLTNNDGDTVSSVRIREYMIPDSILTNTPLSSEGENSRLIIGTSDFNPTANTDTLDQRDSVTISVGSRRMATENERSDEFSPSLEWATNSFEVRPESSNVMMTPSVIDLDGDDIPEIIFSTYQGNGWRGNSLVRALSGLDGSELWTVTDPRHEVVGASSLAVGDIDRDGSVEILALHESYRVIAFNSDGSFRWLSDEPVIGARASNQQWAAISLADLNNDGMAEIIVGASVLSSDGRVLWNNNGGTTGEGDNSFGAVSLVADLNRDGVPEVLAGNTAYDSSGEVLWQIPIPDSFNAIGNFDSDPEPEIVLISQGRVYLADHDGGLIWGPVSIPGGGEGGPPTIADFDNDGSPEIGVAGANRYSVFEGDGSIRWDSPTRDGSSRVTGSSVFDFDGDGTAEVAYGDETHLRIYDGVDGTVLFEQANSTCTTFEYPVIADVDGDLQTELLFVSNTSCGFGSQRGLTVLSDSNWVPTRPIWNQHSYHITNINDDGTIPRVEANSWEIYNNYRRNLQPTGTQLGLPLISVTAPRSTAPAGTQMVLSGNAQAQGTRSTGQLNTIDLVTVNGRPVDVLDAAGQFFAAVDLLPGENEFTFTATDAVGQTVEATITLTGTQPTSEIDFGRFSDITGTFAGVYGRTSFHDETSQLHVDLATRNDGTFESDVPLLVGVRNISDPSVRVVDPDGFMPDGTPFYDFSDQVDGGRLQPGELTGSPTITFFDPQRQQFEYELVFFGKLNEAPIITTIPGIEAPFDRQYTYDVDATDADGDSLTYSLAVGPNGMTIDGESGVIDWTPTIDDFGLHDVVVEVSDGRGGQAEQRYVLTVNEAPPNRPPVITSTPVTVGYLSPEAPTVEVVDINLGSWETIQYELGFQPDARWELTDNNESVVQTVNADASIFLSDFDISNQRIEGTWTVETPSDDDFMGFVFGYQDEGHFYLFDWKQRSQSHRGFAEQGMSIKVVSADLASPVSNTLSGFDLWQTSGVEGRAETIFHNTIPWQDFVEYEFALDFRPGEFTVTVTQDGTVLEEVTLADATYADGRFGFYNYSQGNIRYSGFTRQAVVESAYTYVVQAFDPDDDELSFSLKSAPDGMRINSSSGAVSWGPTADQVGNHDVTVEVSDGNGGIAIQEFVVCVHPDPTNHAPVIVSRPGESVNRGVDPVFRYDIEAVDPDSDQLRFEKVDGPDGLQVEPDSGLVTWDTADVAVGAFDVSVQVADGRGGIDQQTFTVNVSDEAFGSIRGIKFEDANVNGQRGAEEPSLDGFVVYLDQNLNGVLDQDERRTITDSEGRYAFDDLSPDTYYVREQVPSGWNQTFPFEGVVGDSVISNGGFEEGSTTTNFETFTQGELLSQHWIVTEPTIDVVHRNHFLASRGNYAIDLTGTPGAGAIEQTFATDVGKRYLVEFDLAGNPISGPAIKELEVSAGGHVENFQFDIRPFNSSNLRFIRQQFEFEATSDSTTLKFDSLTEGQFGPAIDSVSVREIAPAGYHTIVLNEKVIVDGVDFGNVREATPDNAPPTIVSEPLRTAETNALFRYDALATDVDGDPIEYSVLNGPTGLTVHPTLGAVVWIPSEDQAGLHDVVLQARDGLGGLDNQSFQIDVSLPNAAPIITSQAPETVVAGASFTYRVRAQDADMDELSYSVTGIDGAVIQLVEQTNENDELIDRFQKVRYEVPAEAAGSELVLTVIVSDGRGGVAEQTSTIRVVAPGTANVAPRIDDQTSPTAARFGLAWSYPVIATDADGDALTYTLDDGPAGMTILDAGIVRWNPENASEGSFTFTVNVSDGNGGSDSETFDVPVLSLDANRDPVITSVPVAVAVLDHAYQYDPVARDADRDPLVWSLDQAPRGMSIDPQTGSIRWRPDDQQLGVFRVAVTVTDPFLGASTQTFELHVGCNNLPPAILSVPPTSALTDRVYLYAPRGEDSEGDTLAWSLGDAPAGMSIDAVSGVIRWTPTTDQIGGHDVLVEVSDGVSTAIQTYRVVVVSSDDPVAPNDPTQGTKGNRAPIITSQPTFAAEAGLLYQYSVVAIDPDGDAISYSLGDDAPAEMQIDSVSGLITWTPTIADVGDYTISIHATDGVGATSTQGYLLSVRENQSPEITSTAPTEVILGAVYRYTVRATDPDGDELTYQLQSAPDGMTIDERGRILWQTDVDSTEPQTVTVRVADDRGASDDETWAITTVADTQAPIVAVTVQAGTATFRQDGQVDLGSNYIVQVSATDNVGIADLSLLVNGDPVALNAAGSVTLPALVTGDVLLQATATDTAGLQGSQTLTISIVDSVTNNPGDGDDRPPRPDPNLGANERPIVTITSPTPASTISNVVPIIGTVDDPDDNLWYYRVYYARADQVSLTNLDVNDPDWVVLKQSTEEVIEGELAVFDPSALTNDPYAIIVAAYDSNGRGFIQPTMLYVEGNVQVGNFQLAFTDLSIPLAGIPIEVSRVYDTVNAQDEGDFGFGWTLGVQDARIFEAAAVGAGGAFNPGNDKFHPDATKVYLTNPAGQRVGFTYKEQLISASFFGGIWRPYFEPDPGVYDTLTIDETQVARGGLVGALSQGINPDNYTLTTKEGTKYRYNQFAGLETITDLNGNIVTFTDDGISHSLGDEIQFVRDHRGRISQIVDPAGNAIRYEYDLAGDLVRVTNQAGLETRYEYLQNPAHYLDEAYDSLGNRVLKAVYEQNVETNQFEFKGVIDAAGNRVDDRDFDTDANTGVIRDANGNATTLIYDDRGNVLEEIDPFGNTTVRVYGDPANPDLETRIIDRDGNVVDRSYDDRGNLLTIVEMGSDESPLTEPIETTFTYDLGNRVTSITNAEDSVTLFGYDERGNLTSITNALGDESSFTYDASGRRASFTDFAGNTTTFTYDGGCQCGSPDRVTYADGSYQVYAYNQFGQVTLEQTFEADGTLVEQQETVYDNLGRTRQQFSGIAGDPDHPRTIVLSFYDGHLLDWEAVVSPESLDENGNFLESPATPVDERSSRITDFEYDSNDRLIRQTDAEGGVVEFRYDEVGNRILLQDPVGNITTWIYDDLNRVAEERDPLSNDGFSIDEAIAALAVPSGADPNTDTPADHVRAFAYDSEGNQVEMIDRNGRRREFDYDYAGRLVAERWYASETNELVETITFGYDLLGNMLTATDANSDYAFTYDVLNRLTSVDNNPRGIREVPQVILFHEYDAQGNVTLTRDDAGVTVESEYDSRNRLAVRKWYDADGGGDVDDAQVDFFYNAAGRESEVRRYSDLDANTLVGRTVRTYDTVGRSDILNHVNAVDELLAGYDYDYDFGGLLIHEARTHQDAQYEQTIDYEYDLTGQLTFADFDTQNDERFVYDANGNRITSENGDDVRNYTTGPANQLESDGIYNYEYDGEGNQVKRIHIETGETRTLQYDHHNRLVRVDDWSSDPGDPNNPATGAVLIQTVEYTYDAQGRRIAREVDPDGAASQQSEEEFYYYHGNNVWADFNDGAESVSRYLFGNRIDQNLAQFGLDSGMIWYLRDRLDTVRRLANENGEVATKVEYSLFGAPIAVEGQMLDGRFLFTSRELDQATDTYFFRARTYSPSQGKFLSEDPIGFASSELNLSRFVFNSPVGFNDPSGLLSLSESSFLLSASSLVTVGVVSFVGAGLVVLFNSGPATIETSGLRSIHTSGEINALRHCVWMARSSSVIGPLLAVTFGELFEAANLYEGDYLIDRHNNLVGAGLGAGRRPGEDFLQLCRSSLPPGGSLNVGGGF
ncbi:MAG: choice-of-anchor C family protein [Planctomycetota bacterium]